MRLKCSFSFKKTNGFAIIKIFILTHLLQTALLVAAIWSIFSAETFTAGLLFSTITYVEMLNSHIVEVNDNIILLKDLKETAERLKE